MKIHPLLGILSIPLLAAAVLFVLFRNEDTAVGAGRSSTDRVSRLTDDLENVVSTQRQNAIDSLVRIGEPAIPPLIAILKEPGLTSKRLGAEETLGRIGQPAIAPLVSLLDSTDADTRSSAARALGLIGKPAIYPMINATLESRGGVVTERDREIEKTLVSIGADSVDPLLYQLRVSKSEDGWHMRWVAAQALGELKDVHAIDALRVAARQDVDSDVRKSAANALASLIHLSQVRTAGTETPQSASSGEPLEAKTKETEADREKKVAALLATAKSLWGTGESQRALDACDKALKIEPNNEQAAALREKYARAIEILNGTTQ